MLWQLEWYKWPDKSLQMIAMSNSTGTGYIFLEPTFLKHPKILIDSCVVHLLNCLSCKISSLLLICYLCVRCQNLVPSRVCVNAVSTSWVHKWEYKLLPGVLIPTNTGWWASRSLAGVAHSSLKLVCAVYYMWEWLQWGCEPEWRWRWQCHV